MREDKIKAGCSGYRYYRPPNGWKEKYKQLIQAYADMYPLVEVNSTFYKLPRVSTVKKWKTLVDEVNNDFIFIVKANQRITHLPSSPTYKKVGIEIDESNKDKLGFFKSTEEVFKAWNETKEVCEALEAEVCLFQSPWSFTPVKEHLENLNNFFSQIRSDLTFAFEPRGGKWTFEIIKKVCEKHNIIPVGDPLKEKYTETQNLAYFRLHGLGDSMYRYKFTNSDLKNLYDKCEQFFGDKIFVLFNNYEMFNDCERFLKYIQTGEFPEIFWGAKAIVYTIEISYPTTKDEILSKCGHWWVWIQPKKRTRVSEVLKLVDKDKFFDEKELLQELKKSNPNLM